MAKNDILYRADATDWGYLSEGGKHAIFAYNPKDRGLNDAQNTLFTNKILRIDKELFQFKSECLEGKDASHVESQHLSVCQKLFNGDESPRQKIYLDPPTSTKLHKSFLEGLRQTAIQSGKIPPSRQSDWGHSCLHARIEEFTVTSMLMPNYRIPHALSVEIKPKAGYLASSPLVHPKHRAKFEISRFQILQHLNYEGIISKGWNKGIDLKMMSKYDPLDLFSCDVDRIRQAIEALFCHPQNNLKVSYGHQEIFADRNDQDCPFANSIYDPSSCSNVLNLYDQVLGNIFGLEARHEERSDLVLEGALVDILTEILSTDQFLKKLRQLQQHFDILDVDGAILVYNRLVALCEGSNQEAEEMIESHFDASPDVADTREAWLYGDDVGMSSQPLDDILAYIDSVDSQLLEGTEAYLKGKKLVENLGKRDCVVLLQSWLKSLTLSDLSFFVVIKNCKGAESDNGSRHVQLKNGKDLLYEIKVVDYDLKPAKKLRNREKTESKIALYASLA